MFNRRRGLVDGLSKDPDLLTVHAEEEAGVSEEREQGGNKVWRFRCRLRIAVPCGICMQY